MENLYTVTSTLPIIGMGDIVGPLTTPTKMEYKNVLEMVRAGYNIYQVNPYNHKDKVRVTITNINDIKFSMASAILAKKKNRKNQFMSKPVSRIANEVTTKKDVNENKPQKEDNVRIVKPDGFQK